ncbi:MAG: hypothetical protein R2707_05360 [Acidimicrobiales bacterium]
MSGECAMVQQASFYGAPITENGGVVGAEGTHNAFKLPLITDEFGNAVADGRYPRRGSLHRHPGVARRRRQPATAEAANARIVAQGSGYLSANTTHDTSLYTNELEKPSNSFVGADVARYDGGDRCAGRDRFRRPSGVSDRLRLGCADAHRDARQHRGRPGRADS